MSKASWKLEMQEINASPLVQLVAGQVSVVVLVAACGVQVWSLYRPLYTTSSRVPATERDTASPHHQLQHYCGSHTQHFMLEVKFIWKAAEKYL